MENIKIEEAMIIVGTTPLPMPSEYSIKISTLVDGQPNANGVMLGEEIRGGVLRVDLVWNYLESEKWAKILRLFTGNRVLDEVRKDYLGGVFVNNVLILDPETNSYIRKRMYVSDRQSTVHKISDEIDNDSDIARPKLNSWLSCTLSLIEV